jgi:xylulokinase
MDMRGAASLAKQFGGWINVSGARVDKVANWIRLTGGMPSSTGKDPAGHMLFIRDMFPEVYEKTYKFLNVLDYLNLRLTGRFCATFDSILTTGIRIESGIIPDWSGKAESTVINCPRL